MRATVACLALLTSSAIVAGPQQTTFSPWGKVWTGEIRIVRQGGTDQKKDKSDDKKKHMLTRKRKVTEELAVKVCGLYDDLQVLEANRTLTDQEDWGENIQYEETTCDYPEEARGHNPIYIIKNFKKETKKPGNSTSITGSGTTEMFVGDDAPALKEGVSVKLEFPDSGSFQIDISSLALAANGSALP